MKWYPFWKSWYFSREQRLGIIVMVLMISLILFVKGPMLDYISKSKEEKYTDQNQKKWAQLKEQIDSSKTLAQKQKTENRQINQKPVSIESEYRTKLNDNRSKPLILEVNQSSANEFKKLKGIGEVLSGRIVNYRTKLGGFYSIQQLKEVYGISDSLFMMVSKQLEIDKTLIKPININQSDLSDLQAHPYISPTLAKQIVGYREKVKSFEEIEEIKKMYAMNDSIYNKLFPYLTIY